MLLSVLKPYNLTTLFHRHKKQKVSFDYVDFNFLKIFSTLRITTQYSPSLLSPRHTPHVLCFTHAMGFKVSAVVPVD